MSLRANGVSEAISRNDIDICIELIMKLPEQAKRVFKGVIFDVYQWQQKMFDGSEETFEVLKRPSTVLVLATSGSSVFVCEEEQPGRPLHNGLIGGRQEEGEEPLDCAKRELMEEAGLVSDDWELFKIYQPVVKVDWSVYIFTARGCQKVAEQKLDAGEKIAVKELSFDAFFDLIISEQFTDNELALDVLRLGRDEAKLTEFRKTLFG